jgi:hypothetical protein
LEKTVEGPLELADIVKLHQTMRAVVFALCAFGASAFVPSVHTVRASGTNLWSKDETSSLLSPEVKHERFSLCYFSFKL